MKTYIIKTPTAELLIIELQTEVINSSYHIQKTPKGILIKDDTGEKFISNKYTLIGKPDEIMEDDAAQLIPMYFDYEKTAVEYLVEMIESEIYWVNPYREKVFVNMDISASMVRAANRELYSEKWHEAEQKTFDRKRSLIFKKITP